MELAPAPPTAPATDAAPAAPASQAPADQWMYAVDGRTRGPLPGRALLKLYERGVAPAQTLVWARVPREDRIPSRCHVAAAPRAARAVCSARVPARVVEISTTFERGPTIFAHGPFSRAGARRGRLAADPRGAGPRGARDAVPRAVLRVGQGRPGGPVPARPAAREVRRRPRRRPDAGLRPAGGAEQTPSRCFADRRARRGRFR